MQKTDTTPYSPLGTNYSKGSNLPPRLRPHSIVPSAYITMSLATNVHPLLILRNLPLGSPTSPGTT